MKHLRGFTAIICAVAGTYSLLGAREQRMRSRDERTRLEVLASEAQELVRLRHHSKELPLHPTDGLGGRISGAMARSGLTATVLQSVSPEAETIFGDAAHRVRKQRATLTLSGVSLPQVGGFLDAWRSTEPDWVVVSIDITPIEKSGAPMTGSDLPLRVVIVFEGLFRDVPAGAKS